MSRIWNWLFADLAYALMGRRFKHRLNVTDAGGNMTCVIWSEDEHAYRFNFSVTPRYHTFDPEKDDLVQ